MPINFIAWERIVILGEIDSMVGKPPSEVQHDPSIAPMVKGIEKVIEDFKDGLFEEDEDSEEEN